MNTSDPSGPSGQHVQPAHGKWRRRKGVALILVVAFIVLMSALVVGFFSRVSTELSGARSYAEGVSARQLAESAVSMVMGQIRAATTITNGCWASQPGMIRVYGSPAGQSAVTASAQAFRFYKLYSSHNMVVTNFQSFNPPTYAYIGNNATLNNPSSIDPNSGANTEVPIGTGGWQNQPAYFTDLNAPVAVPNPSNPALTVNRFPIFNPSVAQIPALGQNTPTGTTRWPVGSVEGCSVNLTDQATLALNAAPMPVRWIYVLRDGTFTAPPPLSGPAAGNLGLQAIWNNGGATAANPSVGVPSKANPIVGRIAFWADDDTCKVNINTAGGFIVDESIPVNYASDPMYSKDPTGTISTGPTTPVNPGFFAGSFWDTPRVQTSFDRGISGFAINLGLQPSFRGGLASSQPVRNEFQRYPGHPATTSLAIPLKGLLQQSSHTNIPLTTEALYGLTPRLMGGNLLPGETFANPNFTVSKNSVGGTQQLIAYQQQVNTATTGLFPDPPCSEKYTFPNPLKPTSSFVASDSTTWSWHLWSTVDEMYYATLNTTATTGNGTRMTTNAQSNLNGIFNQNVIDNARFFLTPHSRSPELNLFGRPRVTIWPVPTPASEGALLSTMDTMSKPARLGIRNPSDDLIRFCSTVGADPLNTSRIGQFIFDREDPYSPTHDLLSPRAGSNDSFPRNLTIFNYLHQLTSNSTGKVPGWGQSFEAKYGGGAGGRDQILTEIFDYIRTVNLKDTSRDQRIDYSQGRTNPSTQAINTNAEALKQYARYANRGIVVPTRTNYNGSQVSGFGRFPTISEISLVLYHAGYIYMPNPPAPQVEDVEYDFDLLDERNYSRGGNYKLWFDNNKITGQLIRGFLVFETFNPMQGYGPVTQFDNSTQSKERIFYQIQNLQGFSISVAGGKPASLNIGQGTNNVYLTSGNTWAGRNFGGTEGFFHTMQGKVANKPISTINPPFPYAQQTATYQAYGGPTSTFGRSNQGAFSMAGAIDYYPFQSPCVDKLKDGVRIPYLGTPATPPNGAPTFPTAQQTLSFSGGTFTLSVGYADAPHPPRNTAHNQVVQTFNISFPPGSNWPVPISEREKIVPGEGYRQDGGGFDWRETLNPPFNSNSATTVTDWPGHTNNSYSSNGGKRMPYYLPLRINWAQQNSWNPWAKFNSLNQQVGNGLNYANRFLQILQPGDTIRSLIPGGNSPAGSDVRTVAAQQNITTTTIFGPHPNYNGVAGNVNLNRRAQTLRRGDGGFYFDPTNATWFPGLNLQAGTGFLTQLPNGYRYVTNNAPDLPIGLTAAQANTAPADFDTGIGTFPDGAYCGKADEGNVARSWQDPWGVWHFVEPYFSTWIYDSPGDTYFSPNRQIPSPVAFGSLLAPTTPWANAGWKTLLFCPNPAGAFPRGVYNQASHAGFNNPPDHLLLDLFNMPVVEPYAISEPFSTDGKVNLNYQLMPFGYIERSTALRAALQPLRILAIPNTLTTRNGTATEVCYKGGTLAPNGVRMDVQQNLRYLVDRDETVKSFAGFFAKYNAGQTGAGFFKAASQVCEMFLYPKGQPYNSAPITYVAGDNNVKSWWATCGLTGDNAREKPYSDLYSRVTTKSNTYTVHFRVQSLHQQPFTGNPGSAAETAYYQMWDESRDKVLSEYRGSTTIERYLDPRDPRFYKTINPDTDSLESAYRFRVIYNKRFSPW